MYYQNHLYEVFQTEPRSNSDFRGETDYYRKNLGSGRNCKAEKKWKEQFKFAVWGRHRKKCFRKRKEELGRWRGN